MPASTVIVQHRDGSPARHIRVVIGFDGIFSGGMSRETYTNNYGEACVAHTSTGKATVYVDGKKYHTFHAPGRTAVTLR